MSGAPSLKPITPELYPDGPKQEDIWLCWQYEQTKVPKVAGERRNAASNNPATWRPYATAVKAFRDTPGLYSGIGMVIQDDDPRIGWDLDGCRDPVTGVVEDWALEIVHALDTYAEVSPSGTGLKLWACGDVPDRAYAKKLDDGKKRGIEAYAGARWFAVTGWHLEGTPRTINRRTTQMTKLVKRHFPGKFKPKAEPEAQRSPHIGRDEFDLAAWLEEQGVPVTGEASDNDGRKWKLTECPRAERHSTADASGAYVGQMHGGGGSLYGGIYARCSHAGCGGGDLDLWPDLRRAYEPGWEPYTARNTTLQVLSGGREKPNEEPQEHPFPIIDNAAYRGLFGEIVETIEPHTEADPVAILLSTMTFFGSSYGRRGYVEISGTRHHGNLFVGIVGDTARSRKGTSVSPVKNIFGTAAPEWAQNKIVGGLSSGEGLINVVRDAVEGENKDGDIVEVDKGVQDKRLLVAEGELSQGLKVLRREGNTLSPILRNAWDGGDLATLTRNSPLRATEPHISILGHITSTELLKHLVESEAANGFGNRFLWACVRRSKKLPFGGELSSVDMSPIVRGLRSALDHKAGRMSFARNARVTWAEMYDSLTEDRPGMFGMITARAEAQTLRLAILYALAAGSNEIGVEHLASAYAVWGYCEDSALHLFGDQLGDADADKLLDALRGSPDGMTRTEIRDLFGRNKKPEDLQRILSLLEHADKAYATKEKPQAGGRPTETWFAA
jgi:hypothetical protein